MVYMGPFAGLNVGPKVGVNSEFAAANASPLAPINSVIGYTLYDGWTDGQLTGQNGVQMFSNTGVDLAQTLSAGVDGGGILTAQYVFDSTTDQISLGADVFQWDQNSKLFIVCCEIVGTTSGRSIIGARNSSPFEGWELSTNVSRAIQIAAGDGVSLHTTPNTGALTADPQIITVLYDVANNIGRAMTSQNSAITTVTGVCYSSEDCTAAQVFTAGKNRLNSNTMNIQFLGVVISPDVEGMTTTEQAAICDDLHSLLIDGVAP